MQRLRLLVEMSARDAHRRIAVKRHMPGQHLVEHDAEGIDVGFRCDGRAARLLGREIMYRSHHAVVIGHGGFRHRARDAEIGDLHRTVRHDEDVVRLDVAVYKPGCMCLCERACNLPRDTQRLRYGQRHFLLDPFFERAPGNVLHHDVMPPLGDADIVDVDDVRVRDACRRLCLALKPRDELRIVFILPVKNLNGDGALQ